MEEEATKSSSSPTMQPSTSSAVTASSGEGTPVGQSEETSTERGDDDTEAKNSGI